MKRTLPMIVCFIAGLAMMIRFFVPHHWAKEFEDEFTKWLIAMGTFALIIGVGTLLNLHVTKVRRQQEGWQYSIVTLVSLFAMSFIGLFGGYEEGTLCQQIFIRVLAPLDATMFSLLAFFIASASYRAFRARTFEATLMLFAGIIVMLGRVPVGDFLTGGLATEVTEWIFLVPNMASKRAILLGVALGVIATSLKIMLGIERSWMGTGGD